MPFLVFRVLGVGSESARMKKNKINNKKAKTQIKSSSRPELKHV